MGKAFFLLPIPPHRGVANTASPTSEKGILSLFLIYAPAIIISLRGVGHRLLFVQCESVRRSERGVMDMTAHDATESNYSGGRVG